MSPRVAKWLAFSSPAVFGLSMIVPPANVGGPLDEFFGFQLVVLAAIGLTDGIPLCVLGVLANVSYLLALLLLLIRISRRTGNPGFRLITSVSTFSAVAMAISRVWLHSTDSETLLSPVFVLWFGSAVLLAVGSWRLRVEAKVVQQRGFEVIPVAARAANAADPDRVAGS